MNSYLIERLRCDAGHVLARAEAEAKVTHKGLKGRFRELLIDNLLAPWLPPYVACGTGLIIGTGNTEYVSGQEDIVLYDRTLAPPILASHGAPEGVFLSNSAIGRIEVKSWLKAEGVRGFIESSKKIAELRVISPQPIEYGKTLNLLFAFHSDHAEGDEAGKDFELRRVLGEMREAGLDPLSGLVSAICIADRGFWMLAQSLLPQSKGKSVWARLTLRDRSDPLVWFVACVSNTCFASHAERSGRDPAAGLDNGISYYLDWPFEHVSEPY
jgi:hypothetical protein